MLTGFSAQCNSLWESLWKVAMVLTVQPDFSMATSKSTVSWHITSQETKNLSTGQNLISTGIFKPSIT